MFNISIKKLYWIDMSNDNPEDLCLHGDVAVNIGDEHFEESCTVSTTALYLLKSLTKDHVIHKENQMLPCCGHFLIANESNDEVDISGCPNGVDWSILHENGQIKMITEKGTEIVINTDGYRKAVFDFADEVKLFYSRCTPKIIPSDEFSKNGYEVFWNEWNRLRGNLL